MSIPTTSTGQKLAVVVAFLAVGFGYIWFNKKWSLLCPMTYFPKSTSSGSGAQHQQEQAIPARMFTVEELKQYDGSTDPTNIYVGVKGNVYRVSAQYYGPGANYHCFAGTDASRNLAKGIIGTDEANADWRNLSEEHMDTLNSWETRFRDKYAIVGRVVIDDTFISRGASFEP